MRPVRAYRYANPDVHTYTHAKFHSPTYANTSPHGHTCATYTHTISDTQLLGAESQLQLHVGDERRDHERLRP